MGNNPQKRIMIGILIGSALLAAIFFLFDNANIAWIIIVTGVVFTGLIYINHKRRSGRLAISLDQKDVAQFKSMFSEKSSKELKAIYSKRLKDEYRDEAIEAVRQILVDRRELV